uniref:Uncharacterized protein n=1 Tax=Rhizophora mucronata TaxID=61149 RepID=A0A2P2LZ59_RHIMU
MEQTFIMIKPDGVQRNLVCFFKYPFKSSRRLGFNFLVS